MKYSKIVLLCMLCIFSLNINAHDFYAKNADGVIIFYGITSSKDLTCAVTYRGDNYNRYENYYSGNVVIPSSVDFDGQTYSVTSIGDEAFKNCYNLAFVEIPCSVIKIGENAFENCYSLETPLFNNTLFAFLPPKYQGEYKVPDGIKTICDHAFSYCRELTSVEIPNSATTIGGSAFEGCSCLTSIAIPNSVTSIGRYAFEGCIYEA